MPDRYELSIDNKRTREERESQADDDVLGWLLTHDDPTTHIVIRSMRGTVESVGHDLALGSEDIACYPIPRSESEASR